MRRTPHRPILAAVAAAATVAALLQVTGPATADEVTFATRSTGFDGGEPTLGVLLDGSIVVQAYEKLVRTTDEGLTWQSIHVPPTRDVTLDPYVHVDEQTGRIVTSQLLGACQMISISDDSGATWLEDPTQCGTGDHQKLGSGPWKQPLGRLYPRAVYTCVNHVADTGCAVSQDGGVTWGPLITVFPGVDPTAAEGLAGVAGLCGGLEGDPVSGADGTLYLPREYCGRPFVAVSETDGLTWSLRQVAAPAKTRPIAFGANNPAVTVAADGTLFYAWTGDDWRHYVARSTDKGVTWSAPMSVAPGVLSTTFPGIVAGRAGAVATMFIGTDDTDLGPDAPPTARWDLYVSYTLNGNDPAPVWTTLQLTGGPTDPLMIGCVGRHGTCSNGALLDFNDIALTRDGRIAISYTDACLRVPACNNSSQSNRQRVHLAIQTAGPTFR